MNENKKNHKFWFNFKSILSAIFPTVSIDEEIIIEEPNIINHLEIMELKNKEYEYCDCEDSDCEPESCIGCLCRYDNKLIIDIY